MNTSRLLLRNLLFFRRTNLAMIAGVAIAVAVLSGALLVGQSVRESLRRLAYQRIGATESLVSSTGFFGEQLSDAFSTELRRCPVIYIKGIITNEATRVQIQNVNVYGVDERFWDFNGIPNPFGADSRSASVGEALASQLNLRLGEGLLLRVEAQQAIPKEWLYGRRDTAGRTLRLNCGTILPEARLGDFALRPSQGKVFSIFVPMKRLQRDLGQAARVNSILFARSPASSAGAQIPVVDMIGSDLKRHCSLADFGIVLRDIAGASGFSLETNRIVLDDRLAQSAKNAAAAANFSYAPVYTYLANSIRANGKQIPYSVITAADPGPLTFVSASHPSPDSIWLTDWAASSLGASNNDRVEIDYYLWLDSGQLVTRTAQFKVSGIVPLTAKINSSFAPEIPGITEANSISDWDPPFPLDLNRIRREDEDFWDRRKATPKAFIPIVRGEQLWGSRFGKLTAIRLLPNTNGDPADAKERFSKALLRELDPQQAGFSIVDIRQQAAAASRGSTDFGEYFAYFSSFLIAAALLLAALFFKLMIEQRVREIGILRAAGYPVRNMRRIFLLEGIVLSLAGSVLGLLGSALYGWLMIYGLRTWWVGAVGTRQLSFHFSWPGLLTGAATGMLSSVLVVLWTLRSLGRNTPRMLLSGVLESAEGRMRRARTLVAFALTALVFAALLLIGSGTDWIPQLEGFFGSGFLLLVSILCWTALVLRRRDSGFIHGNGWPAFLRLGLRNAAHRPGRSLICAALIASATFVIISMEAFRQDPQRDSMDFNSGTGGYPLLAESAIPVIHDPNTDEGRETMGLSVNEAGLRFVPFRERPGDDASCLNLYAPQEPKIIGAPHPFIFSGRFSFQSSAAASEAERKNPWLLLESSQENSAIPAIADANTIQYILHLSLGDEITVRSDSGTPVRLRLVGALRNSIFQGELLISEKNFLKYFPEHQGYRFFLIEGAEAKALDAKKALQEALSDWGMLIESTRERLAAYHRVENTYLSTFQSLGALGLILGTAGLATVLLRNVLERRKELALLRAAGYSKAVLSGIIISENVVLLVWGLAAGSFCAFLAIIPALQSRGASFPFTMAAVTIAAVLGAGVLSSVAAVVTALRSPLIGALHSE